MIIGELIALHPQHNAEAYLSIQKYGSYCCRLVINFSMVILILVSLVGDSKKVSRSDQDIWFHSSV